MWETITHGKSVENIWKKCEKKFIEKMGKKRGNKVWGKCEKLKNGNNLKNSCEKLLEKNVEKIGVEKCG